MCKKAFKNRKVFSHREVITYVCSVVAVLSTVVSRKYAPPPFATLASVQNAGGGAYTQDATISLVITPSLPIMKSLSVWGVGQARGVTEREEAGCFHEVAGMSIVDAGGPCSL